MSKVFRGDAKLEIYIPTHPYRNNKEGRAVERLGEVYYYDFISEYKKYFSSPKQYQLQAKLLQFLMKFQFY